MSDSSTPPSGQSSQASAQTTLVSTPLIKGVDGELSQASAQTTLVSTMPAWLVDADRSQASAQTTLVSTMPAWLVDANRSQASAQTTLVSTAGEKGSLDKAHEATLSPEDQAAVDAYEKDIQGQIDACRNTNQEKLEKAQLAVDDLNEDILEDKEKIANDGQDKKKRAADEKKLASDQKKLAKAQHDLSKAMHAKCPAPKNHACVPGKQASIKGAITGEQQKKMNDKNGTNIDLGKVLDKAEGGNYADAYVPWWPDVQTDANGNPVATVDKSGTVMGAKLKNGKRNNSGVTIGRGVDLGKDKDRYFESLDKFNNKYNILTSNEMQNEMQKLKDKLTPYMGLKRAQACQKLIAQRNNSNSADGDKLQNLSDKELDLLNGQAVDENIKNVKDGYKIINPNGDFTKLSDSQQTILFSEAYQGGTGKNSQFQVTASEYGKGNTSYDPPGREHGWINQ